MDFQKVILDNYVTADEAQALLGRTAALVAAARGGGMAVIYVMVAFRRGYPEISAGNRVFAALKDSGLFARESAKTDIHPAVAPVGDEPVVVKHRVGAFSGTDLETLLRANGIGTLVLAGVTTSGVVLSTVRQAFDRDYELVVAGDCCADPDGGVQEVLLGKVIAQHARVVASAELVEALRAGHDG